MNYQYNTRNQSPKGSTVKHIVQYAFLSAVCIWFLYQMRHSVYVSTDCDCNYVQNKFEEEVPIGKMLGRKVNAGSSYNAKKLDLYGIDLIGAAENIKQVAPFDKDSNKTTAQGKDQGVQPDQVELAESESNNESEENKGNALIDGGDESLIFEKQEDEVEKMGALILKSGENLRVVQFSDENGIPEHDSAPSRRSDIQVENWSKGNNSSGGNPGREMQMQASEQICLQETGDKQGLKNFQEKTVYEKVPEMMMVKSRKGSMREILFLREVAEHREILSPIDSMFESNDV